MIFTSATEVMKNKEKKELYKFCFIAMIYAANARGLLAQADSNNKGAQSEIVLFVWFGQ